jgi:hypothetical protein
MNNKVFKGFQGFSTWIDLYLSVKTWKYGEKIDGFPFIGH